MQYDIRRPSGEVSTNYIDTMCKFALYWWPHYHSRSVKVAYVVGDLSQTSYAHRWSVIFRNTAVPWEHKLTRISMIAMIVWWNLLSNTVLYIFAIKTTPDWPGWFLVLHIWHWLLKWSQYRPLWDSRSLLPACFHSGDLLGQWLTPQYRRAHLKSTKLHRPPLQI